MFKEKRRTGKNTHLHYILVRQTVEQNYTRELSRTTTGTFQLNIPSQRYLPKRPYARPRNGRAINYITAFSQVRKSRSSRSGPDQSSRGQREARGAERSDGRALFALLIIGRNHQSISSFREARTERLSVAGCFCLPAWSCHSPSIYPGRWALIRRSLRPLNRYTHRALPSTQFPSLA